MLKVFIEGLNCIWIRKTFNVYVEICNSIFNSFVEFVLTEIVPLSIAEVSFRSVFMVIQL